MLGPYREPGPVEPELPACCAAERCTTFVPHSPHFPASIGCAPPPRRALPSTFTKALSAAATAFLLVASASVSAVTYSVVATHARGGRVSPPPQQAAPPVQMVQMATTPLPPPPRPTRDPGPALSLGMMGEPTHDAEELWRRAQVLEALGADVLLTRRVLPGAPMFDTAALRIVPEEHNGFTGLRVLTVTDEFAAVAGVRGGDLVTALNGYPLSAQADVARAFAAAKAGQAAVAELWREGRRLVLYVDLRPTLR